MSAVVINVSSPGEKALRRIEKNWPYIAAVLVLISTAYICWRAWSHRKTVVAATSATIAEPRGLPQFHVFWEWNYLPAPPPGNPCQWRPVASSFEGARPRGFAPTSFGTDENWRVLPEDLIRCGFPQDNSWASLLRKALDRFVGAPRMVGNLFSPAAGAGSPDDRVRILAVYGLLQAVTIEDPAASYDLRTDVLPRIYRSSALLDRVFTWAMPHVKRVWNALPDADRESYLALLRHAKGYLDRFDLAVEQRYLRSLEQGRCPRPMSADDVQRYLRPYDRPDYQSSPCTHDFVDRGPDGREYPERKIEAFLFRRVRDGMPLDLLRAQVDRILRELE